MKKAVLPFLIILILLSSGLLLANHGPVHNDGAMTKEGCVEHCISTLDTISQAPFILFLVISLLLVLFFAIVWQVRIEKSKLFIKRFADPPSLFRFSSVILLE